MTDSARKARRHQGKRLAAALVITAAIVAAPAVSGLVLETQVEADAAPRISSSLMRGSDPLASLDELECAIDSQRGEPPEAFTREAGIPPGARDAKATAQGTVIGFTLDDDCESALRAIDATLGRKGWTPVRLGALNGATYIKEGGECAWILATCTQVGDSTSVVMQCQYRRR